MPEKNRIQAYFPEGSQVIKNPHGTAPGIDLLVENESLNSSSRVFALPGVPIEMKEMWEDSVKKSIMAMESVEPKIIKHHRIKCFGVGESHLEAMLPDLIKRGRTPTVGITVHQATITLRISSEGEDESTCLQLMQPTIAQINESLGDLIFGSEDEELEHVVIDLLAQRHATVQSLEIDTGGLMSLWLSQADERRKIFRSARILNSDEPLEDLLKKYQPKLENQYLVATGKFKIEESATASQYQYGVADSQEIILEKSTLVGHPEIHRPRAVKQALNLLRKRLALKVNK